MLKLISDHDLVYVALRLKKARTKPVFITTRSFKHYNSQAFNNDVALAPWSIVDAFDDVEDKLHAFNSLFNDILDKHAPIKTFKIRGRPNPCVTENIRELMKTRDRWRKRAKETNDPEAWIEYKNLKHKVRSEIRLAEREFIKDQINKNPNNTNNIWKAIRLCIPNKSSSQTIFSKDDKTVANDFNQFFCFCPPPPPPPPQCIHIYMTRHHIYIYLCFQQYAYLIRTNSANPNLRLARRILIKILT